MKMKVMINNETCHDVVFVLKNDERLYRNKGLLIAHSEYFWANNQVVIKYEKAS